VLTTTGEMGQTAMTRTVENHGSVRWFNSTTGTPLRANALRRPPAASQRRNRIHDDTVDVSCHQRIDALPMLLRIEIAIAQDDVGSGQIGVLHPTSYFRKKRMRIALTISPTS
jgi:hypothetical protein